MAKKGKRKVKITVASSTDGYVLVYVGEGCIGRFKSFEEIDPSKMNAEQLADWKRVGEAEIEDIKSEMARVQAVALHFNELKK